jgi:hypothetical protein
MPALTHEEYEVLVSFRSRHRPRGSVKASTERFHKSRVVYIGWPNVLLLGPISGAKYLLVRFFRESVPLGPGLVLGLDETTKDLVNSVLARLEG